MGPSDPVPASPPSLSPAKQTLEPRVTGLELGVIQSDPLCDRGLNRPNHLCSGVAGGGRGVSWQNPLTLPCALSPGA